MIDMTSCAVGLPVTINELGLRALRPAGDIFDITPVPCRAGHLCYVIEVIFSTFLRVDSFPDVLFMADELDLVVDPRPDPTRYCPATQEATP